MLESCCMKSTCIAWWALFALTMAVACTPGAPCGKCPLSSFQSTVVPGSVSARFDIVDGITIETTAFASELGKFNSCALSLPSNIFDAPDYMAGPVILGCLEATETNERGITVLHYVDFADPANNRRGELQRVEGVSRQGYCRGDVPDTTTFTIEEVSGELRAPPELATSDFKRRLRIEADVDATAERTGCPFDAHFRYALSLEVTASNLYFNPDAGCACE